MSNNVPQYHQQNIYNQQTNLLTLAGTNYATLEIVREIFSNLMNKKHVNTHSVPLEVYIYLYKALQATTITALEVII